MKHGIGDSQTTKLIGFAHRHRPLNHVVFLLILDSFPKKRDLCLSMASYVARCREYTLIANIGGLERHEFISSSYYAVL
jgi:hypothetical protein